MNIFYLDKDPQIAAQMACDRHVLSGIREMTIMLSYVGAPPRKGYYHHKCSKWIRESVENYMWAAFHAFYLCYEYTYRYGRVHKNLDIIQDHMSNDYLIMEKGKSTPIPLAMPEDCRLDDPVQSYRNYYLKYKQHLLTYTRREIPEWIQSAGLGTWKEAKCLKN